MQGLKIEGSRTPLFSLKTKKKRSNVKSPYPKRKIDDGAVIENLEFGSKVFPNAESPQIVVLTLPLRTVSEANCFEPWQKRHRRHKAQKKAVFFALLEYKHLIQLPCKITYIRYAPKELDVFENLPMSFKYINDALCAEITGDHRPGRADGDKRITLSCDQVKSKVYAVKIIIEF